MDWTFANGPGRLTKMLKPLYRTIPINLTSVSSNEELVDMPCGECNLCCSILTPYLTPEELNSGKYPLSLVSPSQEQLRDNPSLGPVMTIFRNPITGGCSLLINNRCSIYDDRPISCRQFDCRKGHHPKIPNMINKKSLIKILIMGLPGSGKTFLADALTALIVQSGKSVTRLNADAVRKEFNDWDFSTEGRIRQSLRMRDLAQVSVADYVVCDFVAPLKEMRLNFNPDFLVWVDTIQEGRYEDTNKIFVKPDKFNLRVIEQDSIKYSKLIFEQLVQEWITT